MVTVVVVVVVSVVVVVVVVEVVVVGGGRLVKRKGFGLENKLGLGLMLGAFSNDGFSVVAKSRRLTFSAKLGNMVSHDGSLGLKEFLTGLAIEYCGGLESSS